MRAANEDVHPIRLMHALGAQGLDIQEWEIAVLHRERPARDGAGAQVTWARVPPNHLNELLDAYRHNLMPRLRELTGFDSLSMLVDRRTGRAVSVTAFETRDALALVRQQARHLREPFAQAMGARVADIAEMDLAVAHLRVPERSDDVATGGKRYYRRDMATDPRGPDPQRYPWEDPGGPVVIVRTTPR
ncbi:hypothetical protein [Blastococcus sp. SYSU D01042]